jgi:hypothetical protein
MLRTATDDADDLSDKIIWDIFMEQIGHRVHEHPARFLPTQWLIQPIGVTLNVCEFPAWVDARPPAFGVAVFAALADFGAAGDGVPGLVGPFYFTGHRGTP